MKKLRTLVEVEYNKPIKGTELGIVIGVLGSTEESENSDTFGANFGYFKADGTPIAQKAFYLSEVEQNAMYDMLIGTLPKFTTYVQQRRDLKLAAFKYQMAQTYGITVDQIEEWD